MQSRIEAGPSQPQQRHRWPELLLHLAQDVREKRVVAKVHVAGLARHERQVRDLWDVVIGHKAPCAPPRGVVPRELAPSLRQGLEAEIALGRAEAELRKGVLVGERRGAAVPSTQGEVVREARRRRRALETSTTVVPAEASIVGVAWSPVRILAYARAATSESPKNNYSVLHPSAI